MFRGLTAVSIDAKGRIAIPGRYRDVISEDTDGVLVLTIDPEEHCLWLYGYSQWEEIENKLSNLPSFSPAVRRLQRLLIGHATELELDKSGRILLPPLLREYANLDKNIMLVGQGNKFEIWDEARWRSQREGWLESGLSEDEDIPPELKSISL